MADGVCPPPPSETDRKWNHGLALLLAALIGAPENKEAQRHAKDFRKENSCCRNLCPVINTSPHPPTSHSTIKVSAFHPLSSLTHCPLALRRSKRSMGNLYDLFPVLENTNPTKPCAVFQKTSSTTLCKRSSQQYKEPRKLAAVQQHAPQNLVVTILCPRPSVSNSLLPLLPFPLSSNIGTPQACGPETTTKTATWSLLC